MVSSEDDEPSHEGPLLTDNDLEILQSQVVEIHKNIDLPFPFDAIE